MNDPSVYWLNVTNFVLGVVVLLCCAAVAFGVLQELAAKRRKRAALAEMDHEVTALLGGFGDGHTFHVPGLGLTMADGGEELNKNKKEMR